jgi:hypothetical protein
MRLLRLLRVLESVGNREKEKGKRKRKREMREICQILLNRLSIFNRHYDHPRSA